MTMIVSSVFTDIGSRAVNEDSVGTAVNALGQGFFLCDGLGGHGMGDAASQLVVSVMKDQFEKTGNISEFLAPAFQASQDILMAEQKLRGATKKMKTTGTALVTDGKYAYIGHVGDSRVYVFRHNKVWKRTLDHSIPQMLVMSGEIKESEIRHHPDRNIVLRVLGVEWDEPQYELMNPIPLRKCQAFLLCSDGFWELIEEKQMEELLKKAHSPEEWLRSMAAVVKENGAGLNMDNNSAIAVWNS